MERQMEQPCARGAQGVYDVRSTDCAGPEIGALGLFRPTGILALSLSSGNVHPSSPRFP